MDNIRAYALSVIAAALIVGILTEFLDKKTASGTLIRFIGGLFLTFTVIHPLVDIDFGSILAFSEQDLFGAKQAAAHGEIIAQDVLADIIKSETEAYILDKARTYEAEMTVEVTLSQDEIPIPIAVRLQGDIGPYAKYQLQRLIESELGIPKEDQQWTQ